MAAPVHYPIRVVARLTGLSTDTLRAWERRYGAVTPVRDGRGRVYTPAHVERLTTLARLVDQGHAIGRIAGMSDAALQQLQHQGDPPAVSSSPATNRDAALLDAARHYDLDTVESLLSRQAVLLPPAELIFSIVLPLLRDAGTRWESGLIRPSHEHLLSAVIRNVLGGVLRTLPRRSSASGIVMATLQGERHELGLLCGAVLAAAAGLRVLYLGPDLPAADIVHAAAHSDARIVLTTATVPKTISAAQWKGLAAAKRHIELWAGGASAHEGRDHLGTRLKVIARMEDLPKELSQHAG